MVVSGSLTPYNKTGRFPLLEWITRVPMLNNRATGPCESVIFLLSSSVIV
jgi:hypothetical protein